MKYDKDTAINRRNFIAQGGAATALAIGTASALQAQPAKRVALGTKPPLT